MGDGITLYCMHGHHDPAVVMATYRYGALKALTKPLDVSVGDQTGSEAEERFVDVVASFPPDPKAAEAVKPGDRALDDVTEEAQAAAVGPASLRNHRADPALPEQATVLVVVVATVGQQRVRPSSRAADPARDGRTETFGMRWAGLLPHAADDGAAYDEAQRKIHDLRCVRPDLPIHKAS